MYEELVEEEESKDSKGSKHAEAGEKVLRMSRSDVVSSQEARKAISNGQVLWVEKRCILNAQALPVADLRLQEVQLEKLVMSKKEKKLLKIEVKKLP